MNKKNEAVITAKISYDPCHKDEISGQLKIEGRANDILICLSGVVTSLVTDGVKVDYILNAVLSGIEEAYGED